MPRLLIVEPELASIRGHYLPYVLSVCRGCAARGLDHRAFGNGGLDDELARQYGLERGPRFSFDAEYRFPMPYFRRFFGIQPAYDALRKRRLFLAEFARFAAPLEPARDQLWFFPSVRPPQVLALEEWLRRQPAATRPRVGVVLRYSVREPYPSHAFLIRQYRRLFAALSRSPVRDDLALFSDSERLIGQYGALGARDVSLIPIPHACRNTPALPATPPVNIGFTGLASEAKGYALLPEILAPLQADIRAGRAAVHVQANYQALAGRPYLAAAQAATERLRKLGAVITEGAVTEQAYQDLLNRLHVLTLPYDTSVNDYSGTSGVFAEAVADARVTVTTRGTWMAEQLDRLGSGCTAASGDIAGFRAAVLQVFRGFDRYARAAARAAVEWRAWHNGERLVDCLAQRAGWGSGG